VAEGRYIEVNESFLRLTGYTREEVIGRTIYELGLWIDPARHRELAATVQKKGRVVNREMEFRTKSGDVRVGSLSAELLEMRGTPCLVAILRDVTSTKRAEEALRRSEEHYRFLFQKNPHAMWVYDLESLHFLEVNDVAISRYGYSREEFLGMTIKDIRPPEDVPRLMGAASPARADIEHSGIWRHRKKDGTLLYVDITSHALDYEGRAAVLVLAQNVTEQVRAEEQLRIQGAALASAANAVLITNVNGVINWVNPAFTALTGYAFDEAVGQNPRILHSGQHSREFYKSLWSTILSGRVWHGEMVNKRKDGQLYTEEMTVTPVRDSTGNVTHFIAIKQDVTDRRRTEQALRESEGKFRALAESASAAIFISQGDRMVYANAATAHILGVTQQELLGREFWDFIHPDSRELVRERREARMRGAEVPPRYEVKMLTSDKKERWIDFTATMVEWEGQPAVLGTAFDVTERKKLEEQFRQAQKMEAVGRLAGGIAHDFNNLLGVIIGYSELLLETPSVGDAGVRRKIEEIHKAAGRAASLTRQLLAFSRQQVLEPRVLNLNAVVEEMEKMLRRLIGEDIELVTHLDEGLGLVKADPGQLEQVVMNLAVNARDAMPRGGRLVLQTSNADVDESMARQRAVFQPGRYVLLSVSDTGIGMDEEVRTHLFEPFFTTKEKGKGTGLGLATVYGIVKQSGGYIWVYSEPGRGSTFKIYLPRVDEAEPETRPAAVELETLRGTETVLVVEDEESLRQLMCEFLRQSGYTVLEAGDATSALAVAARHAEISLLVTDVVLPGRSGRELAETLQKKRPQLKVVYVSGHTDDAMLRHGIDDPGVAFLQKPFSRDAFLRKVRATLDEAGS
jgi:PAS domain S-box-containing protein